MASDTKFDITNLTNSERLLKAAESSDWGNAVMLMRQLIEKDNVSVNVRDEARFTTPLMKAAAALAATPLTVEQKQRNEGKKPPFDFLLSQKPKFSARDNAGWNFLHWACYGYAMKPWERKDTYSSFLTQRDLREFVSKDGDEALTHTRNTPFQVFIYYFFDQPNNKRMYSERCEDHPLAVMLSILLGWRAPEQAVAYVGNKNSMGMTASQMCPSDKCAKEIEDALQVHLKEATNRRVNDDDDDGYETKTSEKAKLIPIAEDGKIPVPGIRYGEVIKHSSHHDTLFSCSGSRPKGKKKRGCGCAS